MCGGKATEEQIADRLSADASDKRSDEPKTDTRAAVASNAEEYRSRIAKRERAVKAINTRWENDGYLSDNVTDKNDKQDTRAAVAN